MITVRTKVENFTNAQAHYVAQVLKVPVEQLYQEVLDMYFVKNVPDRVVDELTEWQEAQRLAASAERIQRKKAKE